MPDACWGGRTQATLGLVDQVGVWWIAATPGLVGSSWRSIVCSDSSENAACSGQNMQSWRGGGSEGGTGNASEMIRGKPFLVLSRRNNAAVQGRVPMSASIREKEIHGREMSYCKMVAAAAAGVVLLAMFRRRGTGKGVQRIKPRVLSRNRLLTSKQNDFSIVSYNVLCDRFATGRRLPHVYHGYLDWDYRWSRLKFELSGFDADIICLQEVTLNR